jgi:hemolysin activation/secretion protein
VRKETKNYKLDGSLGWLFQHSKRRNVLGGDTTIDDRVIDLSMPSLTIGYSAKTFDRLGGRNYWSTTLQGNFAGKAGASPDDADDESASADTPLADGTFVVNKFNAARVQKLFAGEDGVGRWSLFMSLRGQATTEALVDAVKMSLGGANSVRGYQEREALGDYGIVGTLELRTPLVDNFIPGLTRSEEYMRDNPDDWKMHRLQFVGFVDAGFVESVEPGDDLGADHSKRTSFSSAGIGFRLGLTKYSQIKFDYGWPFEETQQSSSHGRGHVSLQLQF